MAPLHCNSCLSSPLTRSTHPTAHEQRATDLAHPRSPAPPHPHPVTRTLTHTPSPSPARPTRSNTAACVKQGANIPSIHTCMENMLSGARHNDPRTSIDIVDGAAIVRLDSRLEHCLAALCAKKEDTAQGSDVPVREITTLVRVRSAAGLRRAGARDLHARQGALLACRARGRSCALRSCPAGSSLDSLRHFGDC